jgi:16S rRNA (uracil1498-N3)-methyltransferase
MPQLHRFYVPDLTQHRDPVGLPDEELHHALHVVRVKAGETVRVFDGAGLYADATVTAVNKRDLQLALGPLHRDPEPATRLTLAQAWLNHAHAAETIIRRGTELGVEQFIFFRAEHSEKSPKPSDKWTRMAIESCKQCGRHRLPTFHTAKSVDEVIATWPACVILATQSVEPKPLGAVIGDCRDVTLIIGPEGDFTARELATVLESGAHPLSLGPLTLRAEVAAATAITLVQYHLGNLGPR